MDDLDATLATLTETLRDLPGRSLAAVFAPSFLAHTPEPLLRTRLAYLAEQFGAAEAIAVAERLSPRSARIQARFAKGYAADGEVALDDEHPPRIQWLRFDLPSRTTDSWPDIEAGVRALPGRTTFEVRDLGRGEVRCRVGADTPVGVGSVSKLVLFWCLLEDVAAGRRRWDDLLRLDDRHRSLPTGLLQDWPAGAPLTLHTAAVLLVSASDNTAADLLLDVLGRSRVEALLARLPLAHPARHRPFCSTRGLFALVGGPEDRRRRWAAAAEDGRRAILADAEAEPLPDLGQVTGAWPPDLDWIFAATELSALLRAVAQALDACPEGRRILAVNRAGLSLGGWPFCGFKGGSSPGRLAFAVLLQDEHAAWYGIALANQATPESLRAEAVAQLIKRAADQLRG